MNEKNHTNRGGYESQTPNNTDASGYNEGSLLDSPIGRRIFLKKTGAATVATAVALHGFRVQVQAHVTGGNVCIWTEYTHGGGSSIGYVIGTGVELPANPTQAQIDAAIEAAKTKLNDTLKELGQDDEFIPGTTQGLNLNPTHFDDLPANYKAGFKVEINGVEMTANDIEIEPYTYEGKTYRRAKLKVPQGGKVKIWVRLPK